MFGLRGGSIPSVGVQGQRSWRDYDSGPTWRFSCVCVCVFFYVWGLGV